MWRGFLRKVQETRADETGWRLTRKERWVVCAVSQGIGRQIDLHFIFEWCRWFLTASSEVLLNFPK